MSSPDRETIPVPAPESERMAQVEAEFRAAASQECAYQMTAFLRATRAVAELGLSLGE